MAKSTRGVSRELELPVASAAGAEGTEGAPGFSDTLSCRLMLKLWLKPAGMQ